MARRVFPPSRWDGDIFAGCYQTLQRRRAYHFIQTFYGTNPSAPNIKKTVTKLTRGGIGQILVRDGLDVRIWPHLQVQFSALSDLIVGDPSPVILFAI
jgi:hypothetical protein